MTLRSISLRDSKTCSNSRLTFGNTWSSGTLKNLSHQAATSFIVKWRVSGNILIFAAVALVIWLQVLPLRQKDFLLSILHRASRLGRLHIKRRGISEAALPPLEPGTGYYNTRTQKLIVTIQLHI